MQLWKDSFNCKSYSSTDTSKVRRSIFISFGVIRNKSKFLFPVPEMVETKSEVIRLTAASSIDNMIVLGQSYLKYLAMFLALPHLHDQGLHCSWRRKIVSFTKVKVNKSENNFSFLRVCQIKLSFHLYVRETFLFRMHESELYFRFHRFLSLARNPLGRGGSISNSSIFPDDISFNLKWRQKHDISSSNGSKYTEDSRIWRNTEGPSWSEQSGGKDSGWWS